MVNIALARLFSLFCTVDAPCSFAFLLEVGAALEKGNVHFVGEIISKPPGNTLDHMLVRAEQEHLQEHVRVYQTQRPDQWDFIRRQLNRLLNDRYVASLSRWCDASRRIVQVLREVRGDVGRNLDFASESHRIRIGLGIIDHIRKR